MKEWTVGSEVGLTRMEFSRPFGQNGFMRMAIVTCGTLADAAAF